MSTISTQTATALAVSSAAITSTRALGSKFGKIVGDCNVDEIDGGAALIARPYDDREWKSVSKAWWWHTAGMVLLPPWYSLVALTVWQGPSRQRVARRVVWATALTLGSLLLIGLPAMVIFSRRWYWMYRTRTAPEDVGVGDARPDASAGYLAWVAVGGRSLADRITRRPPQIEHVVFGEPWASLIGDAAHAVERIERAVGRSSGPATKPMIAALTEATAGVAAAHRVGRQASDVEAALQGLGIERVEQRLRSLDTRDGSDDVDATKRALSEQIATATRMRDFVTRLENQLERLVAQLGEAAARADELSVCPPSQVESTPDLSVAVDRLVAIRSALEAVEAPFN